MLIPAAPQVAGLVDELARWQHDGLPLQLHPGDVGWYAMRGLNSTARSLRVWADREAIYALGLLDGPDLDSDGSAPGLPGHPAASRADLC